MYILRLKYHISLLLALGSLLVEITLQYFMENILILKISKIEKFIISILSIQFHQLQI